MVERMGLLVLCNVDLDPVSYNVFATTARSSSDISFFVFSGVGPSSVGAFESSGTAGSDTAGPDATAVGLDAAGLGVVGLGAVELDAAGLGTVGSDAFGIGLLFLSNHPSLILCSFAEIKSFKGEIGTYVG